MRHAVTGKWRRLHNEELCDVYSSPNTVGDQIKENEMGGVYITYGKRRVAYRILIRKHKGRRPLGRPRNRWDDNIKRAFKKWDGDMEWIDLAQVRHRRRAFVNAVIHP